MALAILNTITGCLTFNHKVVNFHYWYNAHRRVVSLRLQRSLLRYLDEAIWNVGCTYARISYFDETTVERA